MKTTMKVSASVVSDKTPTTSRLQAESQGVAEMRGEPTPTTTITLFTFQHRTMNAILACVVSVFPWQGLANAQVQHVNGLTVLNVESPQADVDFVNARAMQLPLNPLPAREPY